MTKLSPALFSSAVAAGLLCSALAAQTAGNADDVVRLDKFEVTDTTASFANTALVGTKTATSLLETPQTISVISRHELDLRAVKGVAEALRYTAGVSTDAYGEDPRGYAWAKIRGFDVSFDSQYLDGLRLFNYEFPDAFGLERIEVMKGPGSVLYGQSTPGGLINNVSKRPTANAFGEASFELGTGQSYETTVDTGGPVDAHGGFLYRLTALFRDNEKDSNDYTVDARRFYIAPALTWRLSEATTLTLLTSIFHGASTQIPSLAAGPSGELTNAYINDRNWDLEENDIYRIGYQLEHRISSGLILRQSARVSRYDVLDRYLNAAGYESDNVTLDRSASIWESQSRTVAVDTQIEYKIAGDRIARTLLVGLDYGLSRADTQYLEDDGPSINLTDPVYGVGVAEPVTLWSDSRTLASQTGVYAQDQITFDSRWIATLSGRHDWVTSDYVERTTATPHDKTGDAAFSGRAGIAYLAPRGLVPYASCSTSFFPNSGTDFSGTPFAPSKGRQYELGLKYAPAGDRGTLTLSLYDLTQSNVITSDPTNIGFNRAAGKWRSRGIEIESKIALAPGLEWIASASYDDIEITRSNDGDEGNIPGLTPRANASSWLGYTFRSSTLSGLTLGGGVRYIGDSFTDNTNTRENDDYVNLDFAVQYAHGAWLFAFNVVNVTETVELNGDGSGYYPTAGRTLRLNLGYRW
jgi:iron complex outermembrane receptor protein